MINNGMSTRQIEKVIEDPRFSFVNNQINGKIANMLVILPNGLQKLITFNIPDENCTVEDLLIQANLPSDQDTIVSLIKDSSSLKINYIAEVSKLVMDSDIKNDANDFNDNRASGVDLSMSDVAKNESDSSSSSSSDIFSLPKKKKFSSRKGRQINNEKREVLGIEEKEWNDFKVEKEASRPVAHPRFVEESASREEYAIENMTENSIEPQCTWLTCKAVILGSYYFLPQERAIISKSGIGIQVPDLEDGTSFVSVELKLEHALKVLISFEKELPALFIWASCSASQAIREKLGMIDEAGPYYDSVSRDEKHRRITLLPEIISEESKLVLERLFKEKKSIEELTSKAAYNILFKAAPKNIWPELKNSIKKSKGAIESIVENPASDESRTGTVKTVNEKLKRSNKISRYSVVGEKISRILVYPPHPAKGGISINTEDFACLKEDQFLNDSIIDFYLKYLTLEIISENDRDRTYVFSSHFYTRLTSTHQAADESETFSSRGAERHVKVRKWTKNVNIFDKDFIFVPIAENSHWFLAVICFPNLVGTVENNSSASESHGVKKRLQEFSNIKEKKEKKINKSPCILIFDSLGGSANKSQVAGILRDYLTYEHSAKIGIEKIFSKETIKAASPKVPQQFNYSDCGVFLLQYAESFFKVPIEDYTLPIRSLENWFEETVVMRKRIELKKLIFKLANN